MQGLEGLDVAGPKPAWLFLIEKDESNMGPFIIALAFPPPCYGAQSLVRKLPSLFE